MGLSILTGIDLPHEPSCGSMILADDIYRTWRGRVGFVAIEPAVASSFMSHTTRYHLPDHSDRLLETRPNYIESLARFLSNRLRVFKPDAVHIHHLTFGMAQAWLSILPTEMPVVAFCHGTDILAAWDNPDHQMQIRHTMLRAQCTVFPNESTQQQALEMVPEAVEKTCVVPWGLPTQVFGAARHHFSETKRLLYAGRLSANKGVVLLLEAISRVDSCTLDIIGPESQWPPIKQAITRLGLNARVRLSPFLPRQMLWCQFLSYDALVLPSLRIEAFGLISVEAQASGLPVLYANVGGLSDVLGASAMDFEAGDLQSLVSCLSNLTPAQLRHYSRLGIQNANKHQLSDCVQSIHEITLKALDGRFV